ncbi:glycosyltransferase [Flavobacteriaceae bacterium LMO-SS05]
MTLKKRILVAPLNWGLGHATRSIPIIKALIVQGFKPVLASDGVALLLLKKEFPFLEAIELPAYNITYAKKGRFFKLNLLKNAPKLLMAIKAEKKTIHSILDAYQINGIISDNRLGVYSKKVPSVFMTHQLQVLSGNTSWLSTAVHQNFIKRFDECWVPDHQGDSNLSGKLGHVKFQNIPTKYIGPISRFNKIDSKIKYDVMVLLSGPEPQRAMLEEKLLKEFESFKGYVLFVKGTVENEQKRIEKGHMVIYNFMTSELLEKSLNESELIVSRSGYTSIMDLAKLNKKAYFIPTPGQYEQEYLANRLTEQGMVPSCHQDDFTLEKLNKIDHYKGFGHFDYDVNFKNLFDLF